MERSDTKRLQESLEAEAAILRGALRNRESIVIESASEEYERMRLAGQRDLALVFGDRESRRLRYIEAARCVPRQETVDCGPERKDSSFHFQPSQFES